MRRKVALLGLLLLTAAAVPLMAQEAPAPAETEAVTAEEGAAHPAPAGKHWMIYLGAALAIGLPALATGYAQGKIGAAGAGALAERPELTGPVIIMIAIPETAVVFGFVVSLLLFILG